MRRPTVLVAATVLVGWGILAAFAAWIAPHDPLASVAGPREAPSLEHWFGTDRLGRDVKSDLSVLDPDTAELVRVKVTRAIAVEKRRIEEEQAELARAEARAKELEAEEPVEQVAAEAAEQTLNTTTGSEEDEDESGGSGFWKRAHQKAKMDVDSDDEK